MKTTVLKFGGTSMGSGESIAQVAQILKKQKGDKVAVVSAVSGVTDKLIELGKLAHENGNWEKALQSLEEKHDEIVRELGVELNLSPFFRDIKNLLKGISLIKELSASARDCILTFGEILSSHILAATLNKNGVKAQAVDAYEIIFTDDNFGEGNIDFKKSDKKICEVLEPILEEGILPVVTGFIGQSKSGQYITIGRGGSDYTAAIVGAALGSGEVQIWTDVDGIFSADPRYIPKATVLKSLSFPEASELAYFGAKVLHPKTIKPAVAKDIPVKVLNTFNPSAPGTLISNEEIESLKSVSHRKGVSIINICSTGMLDAHGFMAKIFEVFARNKIVVDVVSTSEVSVSVTVNNGDAKKVIKELEEFSTVSVYENMAIVCLVGEGIKSDTRVLGKLFSSLEDYEVSMVSQGASQRNITFLVKEAEVSEVTKKVFDTFFYHS
jgi:aspartate kinase